MGKSGGSRQHRAVRGRAESFHGAHAATPAGAPAPVEFVLHAGFQRGFVHPRQHRPGKGAGQGAAGLGLRSARASAGRTPRPVELAGRRAVAALHVVGVDFEVGLGIDLGTRGQQQVAVDLARVRLLRADVHDRLAIEHAAALVGGDAAIVLQAGRIDGAVVDQDVRIEVARAVGEENPGDLAVRRAPIETDVGVEPCERCAELRVAHDEARAGADAGLDALDVKGTRALVLQAIHGQVRVGAEFDVEDDVGEMFVCIVVHVLEQQAPAAARRHAYDDSRTGQRRTGSGRHQRELQHFVVLLVRVHFEQHGVRAEARVERGKTLGAAVVDGSQQHVVGNGGQRSKTEPRHRDGQRTGRDAIRQHETLRDQRGGHVACAGAARCRRLEAP